MSYLVLARKYRPLGFEAMVGQAHVVQALANALTQQRLHHAYLFTGTRGVGKTTVSRILAKSLNCTGPDGLGDITATPCGRCDACRDIDAGRFVDYVELDAASNRGVDEITQLLDQAVYKPVLGRFKVYMIDEVHMLSNHAFNAMLKTLEEPPDYLKFVLATTDPQKVPPTVLSRCLQFNLRPMAADTVQAHLAQVLAAEGIEAESAALRLLARAARGSMRDALSLTDQAIAFGAGSLSEVAVRQMLGAVDRGHVLRLLDALARADGAGLLEGVDGLRGLGLSAVGTLEDMAALLQQMAVLQAVPGAQVGDEAEQREALRLGALFGADETALLYSMCLQGRAEIGLAPDEYGGLVMVLLRMLAFRPGDRREPAGAPAPRPAQALRASQVATASLPLARPVQAAAPAPAPAVAQGAEAVQVAAPSLHDDGPIPAWLDAPEFDAEPDGAVRQAPADPPSRGQQRPPSTDMRTHGRHAEGEDSAGVPLATERLLPTAIGERWAELVAGLVAAGRIGALTRELAWQAECLAMPEGGHLDHPAVWRLRVEREMLRAPAHVERLQLALAEWLQHPLQLDTEAGPTQDTPALRAQAEREHRQRAAEAQMADDPLVRSLLAEFKTARIVPGSVRPC
jgi:DNA polymerase-3 subunit gamma/tau